MKQKLLMMLAALMVLGTSAMAQSETLKGDVNADGVVDVADIAAVIKIMTDNADNNRETKYYWYVGNTSPESMTPPSVGNANSTLCQWTSLGTSLPTTSIKVYKEDENYDDHTWYVAAPTAAGFVLYDAFNSEEELGYKKTKTFMIGNVSYDLWVRHSQGDQAFVWLHK